MLYWHVSMAKSGTWEPSLSEQAYTVIKSRILKGELPLGAPVSRRGVAVELEMSHLPVAEAMQRLEAEGILESRPRSGTIVRVPTAAEVRERYELREALESQAGRLFARSAGARAKRDMLKMAESVDALFNRCFAGGENDREYLYTVHNFHARFHLGIAQAGGCQALCEALEKAQVLTFNWLQDVVADRPPLPREFHRELMTSLCSGDEETADRAMRCHVRHGLEYVVGKIAGIAVQPAVTRRPRVTSRVAAR